MQPDDVVRQPGVLQWTEDFRRTKEFMGNNAEQSQDRRCEIQKLRNISQKSPRFLERAEIEFMRPGGTVLVVNHEEGFGDCRRIESAVFA